MSRSIAPDREDNQADGTLADHSSRSSRAESSRVEERSPNAEEVRHPERASGTPTLSYGLDLPRDDARHPIATRDRTYLLGASEADLLATIGAFRIVPGADLEATRGAEDTHNDLRHLTTDALIERHDLVINQQPTSVYVLTEEGKSLLDAHRAAGAYVRPQQYHAGLVKPREFAHDAQLYRLFKVEADRITREGGRVRRVVLDYELKRAYQTFLNRRDRPKETSTDDDRQAFAAREALPIVDGHLEIPDLRIEYETPQRSLAYRDVELVTENYSRTQIAGKAAAGFRLYRAAGQRSARAGAGGSPYDPHHLEWLR